MNINRQTMGRGGFSLTEMLIATGIMAIGLVLVATIFPVGVKLTTMTTERSIAAVAADEAFAKVRLYGVRPAGFWPSACSDFRYTANYDFDGNGSVNAADAIDDWTAFKEFYYPSDLAGMNDNKYCWSALCRRISADEVQITAVVNRVTFGGSKFYGMNFDGTLPYNYVKDNDWPTPVRVNVNYTFDATWPANDPRRRQIVLDVTAAAPDNSKWSFPAGVKIDSFIDEGYTLVSDRDGVIYQVEETIDNSTPKDGIRETIVLRQDWQWTGYTVIPANGTYSESVWVVPPAVGSSRYPCVGVYQQVIRFD